MKIDNLLDLLYSDENTDIFAFDTEFWKSIPENKAVMFPMPNLTSYYNKSKSLYSTVVSISNAYTGNILKYAVNINRYNEIYQSIFMSLYL